jgi:hypothetical protein
MLTKEDEQVAKLDPERIRWIAHLVEMDGTEPNAFLQGWVVDARRENIDVLLELAPNVFLLRPADGALGNIPRQELKDHNNNTGPDNVAYLAPSFETGTDLHKLYFTPRIYLTKVSVSFLASMCGTPIDESQVFTGAYIARTGHAPPPRVQE